MNQEVQRAFHGTVGAVLAYLDEDETGSAVKRAIKAELWDLCDKKIQPLIEELETGKGRETDDEEANGNR